MGFGKDNKGAMLRFEDIFTLGTLAGKTALKQDTPPVITEDFRILKQRHWLNLETATFVDGDGPLLFGIVNDELSIAEISECLQAGGPLDRDDRLKVERAERGVHIFPTPEAIIQVEETSIGNTGKTNNYFIESKHRWTYSNANGWSLIVYNKSTGALTTGGILRVNSEYYGVWLV